MSQLRLRLETELQSSAKAAWTPNCWATFLALSIKINFCQRLDNFTQCVLSIPCPFLAPHHAPSPPAMSSPLPYQGQLVLPRYSWVCFIFFCYLLKHYYLSLKWKILHHGHLKNQNLKSLLIAGFIK